MRKMENYTNKGTFKFDNLKPDISLENMILYISEKCLNDPTFGATKLNKILFYSDFESYLLYGEPITGTSYQRISQGPAPKKMIPIRNKMIEGKKIHILPQKAYNYKREVIIPLEEYDISKFKPRDIALIDEIIRVFWGKSAKQISELSHSHFMTNIPKEGEKIPYEAVFISDEELTDYDISYAQDLIQKHGWEV